MRKAADFTAVFRTGKRAGSRYFSAVGKADDQPRLGLAISKKVDKRAVGRNRIKRLIRESYRRLDPAPAGAVVVMAKSSVLTASKLELQRDLALLWQRLDQRLG